MKAIIKTILEFVVVICIIVILLMTMTAFIIIDSDDAMAVEALGYATIALGVGFIATMVANRIK